MLAKTTSQSPLSDEDWKRLLEETNFFACTQVDQLRWRGAFGGVLPEGYDPASIASQAVAQLATNGPAVAGLACLQHPAPIPSSAGLVQWTAEPLTLDPHEASLAEAGSQLRRLVRRQINRLHHLKENSLLRNAPDLACVLTDDGELINPIDIIPAPDPTPLQDLIQQEEQAQVDQVKARFVAFLGTQRRLVTLFNHLCNDLRKPKILARKMGLPVSSVSPLKKRLRRQFRSFMQLAGCYKPALHQKLMKDLFP